MSEVFVTYPGGKNGSGTYQKLINLMPPHHTYIEPFLGSGAIMLAKLPAMATIGIDIDGAVITEWMFAPGLTIPNLTLLQANALDWLKYFSGQLDASCLVYCDPPYLMSTRSTQRQLYAFEMADEKDHRELIAILRSLRCMVMLSGYWSQLYADLLPDWHTFSFQAMTRGGTMATEWVWMNYPPPLELHDYRYLGDNFRERERIKKKKQRWADRLLRMPALERQALYMAIEETRSSPTLPGVTAGNIVAPDDVCRQTTLEIKE